MKSTIGAPAINFNEEEKMQRNKSQPRSRPQIFVLLQKQAGNDHNHHKKDRKRELFRRF
jgi:hypothetical protein